jgi:hypothetical protein
VPLPALCALMAGARPTVSLGGRPAAFASAIVVADALVWEGADPSILSAVGHVDDLGQYLLRALIYRAVTESILGQPGSGAEGGQRDPYAQVVDLACRLAG